MDCFVPYLLCVSFILPLFSEIQLINEDVFSVVQVVLHNMTKLAMCWVECSLAIVSLNSRWKYVKVEVWFMYRSYLFEFNCRIHCHWLTLVRWDQFVATAARLTCLHIWFSPMEVASFSAVFALATVKVCFGSLGYCLLKFALIFAERGSNVYVSKTVREWHYNWQLKI